MASAQAVAGSGSWPRCRRTTGTSGRAAVKRSRTRSASALPADRGTAGDAVPWLSDEQQHDWAALVRLVMTLPTAMDAQLKRDAGLNNFEYHLLARLSMAPARALVLSDLAWQAQGSLSRLLHAITRLERAGWVERRACNDKGRRVEARLTDAGMAKVEAAAPGHVREARRLVVDVLTPGQLAALGEAARAITAVTMLDDPGLSAELGDC